MDTRTKLLVAAVAAVLSGCGGGGSDSDSSQNQVLAPVVGQETHERGGPVVDPGPVEMIANAAIQVLSNRADLVSAGDALIDIHIPQPEDRDGAKLFLNGSQIHPELVPVIDQDGVSRALVSGLAIGANELKLVLPGNGVVTANITNHPAGGPVFSGPQVEPWTCTNGAAVDDQCNQPPQYQLQYVPASTFDQYMTNFDPQSPGIPNAFVPYDSENPPADGDIATVTTDHGVTVPYIVRIETGVLNRDRYQIMSLFQPDQGWTGTHPQPQWNGKVLIHHGGNVGVSFAMGNPPNGDISGTAPDGFEGVLGDSISVALSKGFVTLSTAQANLGHNVNLVTAAESLVMSKERIVEQYGPIRYTIGTGCSGGAIAQQHIANAYPGIYQGLIVQCSYPDVWTTATQFADYNLLNEYFGNQMPESPEDLASFFETLLTSEYLLLQWPALYGHLPVNPVVSDLAFFPSAYPDQESCPGLNGKAEVYHKQDRPDGLRCGLIDYMATQFGTRTPEVWSPNEQLLSRGFGGIPLDNVGVQYGLRALQDGTITADQFLAVNREIGGFDVDIDYQAGRTVADPLALTNAYRTGAINTAENLANLPIIDLRGPDPGIAHDAYHSWQTRARLQTVQGHARNHTIWYGAFPIAGDSIYATEALYVMDDWLAGIEADNSAGGIADKVIANKPLEARDRCLSVSSLLSEHGPFVPYTGNLLTPNPTWTQADMLAFPEVPAELGQILDIMTGQVCGLELGDLGLPPIITDPLSPITSEVVAAQQLVVQTRFGTPRTVAGDSIETLANKCQLKPVDPADYPVNILNGTYDSEAMAREVATIFPDGVCDYSKPGVGTVPTQTWLQYGGEAERIVGGEPLANNADLVSGWAAPSFEVNLAPRSDL
ncbi:DUF6351 family protein [Marinobacter mobilis]|uniref:DUF6351 domain-containing protein n=1 Tax=Marinobacter mobilis TaxID=488533 RepID=A0A1H2S9K9_9GAMM|nr:DUF6351 family protein [Marinobacter mobilis]SDW28286.1 hypothetical protein SAMN04487960_10266 [Marinobacter mobilis]